MEPTESASEKPNYRPANRSRDDRLTKNLYYCVFPTLHPDAGMATMWSSAMEFKMKMNSKKMVALGAGVVALIAGAAIASSYMTRASIENTPPVSQARVHQAVPAHHSSQVAVAQPQPPACDDKNIIGTVGGGVAGGIVGNQFGGGSGKTLATVGGVIGGAYLGNQYLPTRNATCR